MEAIERLYNDPHPDVKKKARRMMNSYRKTGKWKRTLRLTVLYHTRITQHICNRSGQSEIVLSQTLCCSKRVEDMVCVLLESVSVHVCESGRESMRGKRFGAWELSFIPSSHHLPPLPPHHGHRGHCYTCTWGGGGD